MVRQATPEHRQRVKSYFQTITRGGAEESLAAQPDDLVQVGAGLTEGATDEEAELARSGLERLRRGEDPSAAEAFAIEAIILPGERPVIDVRNDSFGDVSAPFTHFGHGDTRRHIEAAIPAIGRIAVPSRPNLPFAGTGFVVGDGLLMTNRHVAVIFAQGLGREGLSFQPGEEVEVDFRQELGSGEERRFEIRDVLMIHPYWDMALLRVEGLKATPLSFLAADPGDLVDREVAVVGYPAFDPRNDAELQFRIFRRVFNVKRLQPGRLGPRSRVKSFESVVSALTHDSTTLGGNSGSAVVDVATGKVVALHFAGIYLKENYGVPAFELARDPRVHDAGIDFGGERPSARPPWDDVWVRADPPAGPEGRRGGVKPPTSPGAPPAAPASPVAAGGSSQGGAGSIRAEPGTTLTWSVPLEVTVRLGGPASGTAIPTAAATAAAPVARPGVERMMEPFHDTDYAGRNGYDPDFLGLAVPLPQVTDPCAVSILADGSHVVPYEHFSLAMHRDRRLALFTAANVDGRPRARQPDPDREYTRRALSGLGRNDQERWFTDPRVPARHQLPDRFFTSDRTSFDKGHIVRRDAVAWGESYDELRRANGDTYHVTNCSPQVKGFNRSNLGGVWGKLENLVLDQSEEADERYCVLAGPVLADDDPPFQGRDDEGDVEVQIPRRYWKIVVARRGEALEAYPFLLEQDLADVAWELALDAEWRGRMVTVADLEERLGGLLRFPPEIHQADQTGTDAGEAVRTGLGPGPGER